MQAIETLIAEIATKAAQEEVNRAVSKAMAEYLKTANQPAEYLTIDETAEILKVSRQSVNNYLNDGKLTRRRIGGNVRIAYSEIEQLLAAPKGK